MISKSAKYLLITKVASRQECFDEFIKQWQLSRANKNRKFFINSEDFSLLELTAFSLLNELPEFILENERIKLDKKQISFFDSDLHQELLEYKEDVICQNGILPKSAYVQMRHVEVPLKIYDEYSLWRNKTIFNHVKNLGNIESFVAYHTLLSTLPGVMFIAGFSCEQEEYLSGFSNERYKEIIRQAGNRYISGGKEGLYTKIYKAL